MNENGQVGGMKASILLNLLHPEGGTPWKRRYLMTNRKSRTNDDMGPLSSFSLLMKRSATSSRNVVLAHKKVSWKREECFIERD